MALHLLVSLLLLVLAAPAWARDTGAAAVPDKTYAAGAADTATIAVPDKAYAVLAEIGERNGAPPPGYVGGRPFYNRERRLPRGRYREYDVNPRVPGRDRGPERIVIDRVTGRAWYTADHYRSFVPMERP